MKKKLALIALVLSLVMVFAACAPKEEAKPTEAPVVTEAPAAEAPAEEAPEAPAEVTDAPAAEETAAP